MSHNPCVAFGWRPGLGESPINVIRYTGGKAQPMSHQAHVVNVLIASPGDLKEVRSLVPPLFTEWNSAGRPVMLVPQMWEHASVPEMGEHPQDIVDRQIVVNSDLLVAVFWTRVGTETAKHISGTIQEIETFIEIKGPKRAMIYFIDKPVEVNPMDLDLDQIQKLKDYRKKLQPQGLVWSVPNESEFRLKLYQHLESKVKALVAGQLPEPAIEGPTVHLASEGTDDQKWPCTLTAGGIGEGFGKCWGDMCARGDKYRDEGARLAARFARAIDQLIAGNEFRMSNADRAFFREQSHALKELHLNARSDQYRGSPPLRFWADGSAIADRLLVHSRFMKD
jgi:hypothetical protein